MNSKNRTTNWRKKTFTVIAVIAVLSLLLAACAPANGGLAGAGITFGSHTVNHRVIGTLPHVESRRFEIFASRERLQQRLDRPVDHFCFPNGGIGDFSHADIDLVREAGYTSSATTLIGMLDSRTDCFQLPRINADAAMDFSLFRMKIAGLFHHLSGVGLPVRAPEV